MLRFYRNPFLYSRWLFDTYVKVVAMGQGNKPSFVFVFGSELNEQILPNTELFKFSSALLKVPSSTDAASNSSTTNRRNVSPRPTMPMMIRAM